MFNLFLLLAALLLLALGGFTSLVFGTWLPGLVVGAVLMLGLLALLLLGAWVVASDATKARSSRVHRGF